MFSIQSSEGVFSEKPSNYTFINHLEESSAHPHVKEEPGTTTKLEYTCDEFVVKSEAEDIGVKLESLVPEEVNIKDEIGTPNTIEASTECNDNYLQCKFLSKVKFDTHMQINTKKSFKCDVCNYRTSHKSHLVVHMRTHTLEKPFKCLICNYRSSQKSYLNIHIKNHTGEKPFKCVICDYTALQKSTLDLHIRTHTGEKPFKCEICNYRASQKSAINRHIRTHTGEKPFKCKICNYESSQKVHLVVHMRTHTGEKPLKCKICNYQASVKGQLVRHTKTHTREKSKV